MAIHICLHIILSSVFLVSLCPLLVHRGWYLFSVSVRHVCPRRFRAWNCAKAFNAHKGQISRWSHWWYFYILYTKEYQYTKKWNSIGAFQSLSRLFSKGTCLSFRSPIPCSHDPIRRPIFSLSVLVCTNVTQEIGQRSYLQTAKNRKQCTYIFIHYVMVVTCLSLCITYCLMFIASGALLLRSVSDVAACESRHKVPT